MVNISTDIEGIKFLTIVRGYKLTYSVTNFKRWKSTYFEMKKVEIFIMIQR